MRIRQGDTYLNHLSLTSTSFFLACRRPPVLASSCLDGSSKHQPRNLYCILWAQTQLDASSSPDFNSHLWWNADISMNNGIIILPDLIPGIGSNKMIGSYMYTELMIHLAATTPVIFEDSKKGSKCMKIPDSKSITPTRTRIQGFFTLENPTGWKNTKMIGFFKRVDPPFKYGLSLFGHQFVRFLGYNLVSFPDHLNVWKLLLVSIAKHRAVRSGQQPAKLCFLFSLPCPGESRPNTPHHGNPKTFIFRGYAPYFGV